MNHNYLSGVKERFTYYKELGEKTFVQLSDEALFWQHNDMSNSVAIIVKHLWGNMLSRWTDFLISDGEKQWRKRDKEFKNDLKNRKELMVKWKEGWQCLFDALDALNEKDMNKTVYIRNEKHTVMEAINRQLTHYAYHIGQIVFIGKMLKNNEWNSLSIPKGGSKAYNNTKCSD